MGLRLLDVTIGTELPSEDPGDEPLDPGIPGKAMDAFLRRYWNAEEKVFMKNAEAPVERTSSLPWPIGPVADFFQDLGERIASTFGLSVALGKSDFWWVPHIWQTVMDAHQVTGDPKYRQLIGEVYDGFCRHYDIGGNEFNDDLVWLALACMQAHQATGEARYLGRARELADSIGKYEDDRFGGGIYWKRDGSTFKNIPINAPYVILCLQLLRATQESKYLDTARRIDTWMEATLYQDGKVLDGINTSGPEGNDWTYNYGTFIGASLLMAEATGEERYRARARKAAQRALDELAPAGILKDEGHGDACGFKMILNRYLVKFAPLSEDRDIGAFLADNARSAWDNRRQSDDILGYDWSKRADSGPIESFAAASGVAIQMQARMASTAGR